MEFLVVSWKRDHKFVQLVVFYRWKFHASSSPHPVSPEPVTLASSASQPALQPTRNQPALLHANLQPVNLQPSPQCASLQPMPEGTHLVNFTGYHGVLRRRHGLYGSQCHWLSQLLSTTETQLPEPQSATPADAQPDLQSAAPADPSWTSSCRPPVLYARHQPPAQFSAGEPVLQPAFTFSQIIRCQAAHQRGSVYVTDV